MKRMGREGRGARRLVLALGVAIAGVALLAEVFLRGPEERAAAAPAPGALAGEGPRAESGAELAPAAGEGGVEAAPEEMPAERAAPDAERVAAPLGPRGRVVDGETGAPVAGVVIERSFAGSVDHRASTGPDGVFAFGPEVNANGTLRAVKHGWRFAPESLRPRHAVSGEGLVFEGERLITAPVRGRVVDELTGQPVARYRMWFGQPGFDESQVETRSNFRVHRSQGPPLRGLEALTDEQGRFETSAPLEQGTVEVRLFEAGLWRKLEHVVDQGAGAEHELAVALGPTLRFDLELPEDVAVEHLEVFLMEPAVPVSRAVARAVESGWITGRTKPLWSWSASVHGQRLGEGESLRTDGDPAWVRLPPLDALETPASGPRGYALEVSGSKGLLAGVGYAAALAGEEAPRIAVRVEPFAILDGRVTSARGDMVNGALVTLSGGAPAPPLACITDRRGIFRFHAPPGRYDLAVDSLHGSLREVVELAAEERLVELKLPPVETMRVEGRIDSRSGDLTFKPLLELRSIEDPELRFPADVDLLVSEDRRWGRFSFAGVPVGTYELLAPSSAGFAVEPSRMVVDRPATDLALVCLDEAGATELGMFVSDVEGQTLSHAQGWFWIDGGWHGPDDTMEAAPGSTVRWLACAARCVPAEGTRIVGEAPERIDVQLASGAGLAVFAKDPWGAPVEGAEILLDGRVAGRTDERGVIALALPDAPRTLAARKAGWTCAAADLKPEEGAGFVLLAPED